MGTSTERIADRIRIAAKEHPKALMGVLSELLTDPFQLEHEPAGPQDGPMARDTMLTLGGKEMDLLTGEIDGYRFDDVDVSVDGHEINVTYMMAGRLPDGRSLAVPSSTTFTVADGRVTKMVARSDTTAMAPVVELVMKSGIFSDRTEG